MEHYGKELILDLKKCDVSTFSRKSLIGYFKNLCKLINMERCELYFWDDFDVPMKYKQTNPKTKGTSAIQFILTSNITIHTLDLRNEVYVNIFSCKDFDSLDAAIFTKEWFGGDITRSLFIDRG